MIIIYTIRMRHVTRSRTNEKLRQHQHRHQLIPCQQLFNNDGVSFLMNILLHTVLCVVKFLLLHVKLKNICWINLHSYFSVIFKTIFGFLTLLFRVL